MNKRKRASCLFFALAAQMLCAETHKVPLFLAAGDSSLRSVVRVINLSDEAGPVTVTAFTDGGVEWEGTSFRIEGNAVFAFNSDDLEYGDPDKGLTGIGTGDGDWHLTLDSELPLTVSTYARSADGLLTEMNRTVPRDPDGIHRVMTFNPRTAMRRVSQLRLVNPHDKPVTVTVKGIDDMGADSDGSVTVTLAANEARTLTAGQLEDRGLGDGAGKWRLFVTATEPITVMNLMRTISGHLANLSSAPEAEMEDDLHGFGSADTGTVIPLFTSADSFRQSFARIINRSDAPGTVIVEVTDDSGTVRGQFRLPIGARQERSFTSDDLENGNRGRGIPAIGGGTGAWRLTVRGVRTGLLPTPIENLLPLDLQVLAYLRTQDGFFNTLHDLVYDVGNHQVPVFNPAWDTQRESALRVISTVNRVTTVTVRGYDDAGTEGDAPVTFTLRPNEATILTSRQLESTGLGDGTAKWRLVVSADNPVGVMNLMRTPTGHLTNISYLPETERVVANTLSASFTYEEDEGTPFGIRFNANSSTGSIVSYDWDFGEVSRRAEKTPGTGVTPFFVYDDLWSHGQFSGNTYGYEGSYPHTDTYTVTLTITDRAGSTAKRTKKVRVTNTLRFPGLRDLIGRISDGGGHRGKLVLSELEVGDVFGGHAKQTVYVNMKGEGVPEENILVHGPGVTNRRMLHPSGILTHPANASLRAETLVVNRSTFPAYHTDIGNAIAEHNIVFVAPTGNVSSHGKNECNPENMPDRDLWNRNHSFHSCNGRTYDTAYRGAMEAIATGKALFATSADLQQDGSVEPHSGVIKCGDTRRYCFAVPTTGGTVTSSATAKLSAAVFHLFQLYEDAEDVVRALKRCTRDIGAPGIDREFGNGLVDFRCVEATRPVFDR